MILDHLANWRRSIAPGSLLAQGCEYLETADWKSLGDGKHVIEGERLFVLVSHDEGRGRDGARLESHRKYLDIQLVLEGCEHMGWRSLGTCQQPSGPFDTKRDIVFYEDRPALWFDLPAEHFVVFHPDDVHAPLAGQQRTWKAVMKVVVD